MPLTGMEGLRSADLVGKNPGPRHPRPHAEHNTQRHKHGHVATISNLQDVRRNEDDVDCDEGGHHTDRRLLLQFRGSVVTLDAGLLAYRELDEALGLSAMAGDVLADARTGKNGQHQRAGLLRSVGVRRRRADVRRDHGLVRNGERPPRHAMEPTRVGLKPSWIQLPF